MSHITAENCKLLEMLCLLLNEQELQLGAAECLLIAVSRKVSYHFKLTFIPEVSEGCVCLIVCCGRKTFKGLGVLVFFTRHQLPAFNSPRQQLANILGIYWQNIQRFVGLLGS